MGGKATIKADKRSEKEKNESRRYADEIYRAKQVFDRELSDMAAKYRVDSARRRKKYWSKKKDK